MTRDEAREFAKLVQAYADGQQVQFLRDDGRWADLDGPDFYSRTMEFYRIKPEPREWWIVCCRNGKSVGAFETSTEASADACQWNQASVIKVREVAP